jgi:chromosome segregation ATPase
MTKDWPDSRCSELASTRSQKKSTLLDAHEERGRAQTSYDQATVDLGAEKAILSNLQSQGSTGRNPNLQEQVSRAQRRIAELETTKSNAGIKLAAAKARIMALQNEINDLNEQWRSHCQP